MSVAGASQVPSASPILLPCCHPCAPAHPCSGDVTRAQYGCLMARHFLSQMHGIAPRCSAVGITALIPLVQFGRYLLCRRSRACVSQYVHHLARCTIPPTSAILLKTLRRCTHGNVSNPRFAPVSPGSANLVRKDQSRATGSCINCLDQTPSTTEVLLLRHKDVLDALVPKRRPGGTVSSGKLVTGER